MYRKVYLEITNVCNLNCSFCHKTKRKKKFMTEEEFSLLCEKIRPFTEYIYFHLMGEPLLHPEISKFLDKAHSLGFKATVATNGFLIKDRGNELLNSPPYKMTFSLHSYESNTTGLPLGEYIENIISFCREAEKKGTICVLRLWNEGGENLLNEKIISILKNEFTFRENRRGFTLSDRIYLEKAEKFIWPDKSAPTQNVRFCMGLRDHVGVLCDGTVVPCCLDADGEIPLGNLFNEELGDIVKSERAVKIYQGFSENRCEENLCSRCQYATRF